MSDLAGSPAMERLRAALAGTYRLERELGGAGMSLIFVAEELRLKRRVVIKVLPPETIPTANAERFRREIEMAAQLQHPHIVPLLTADTADTTLFYTMPFVTGESLRDRLRRDGRLPLEEALRIWRDVLDALAHAHARGVIHRDIKPGNILLSGRHALVTDFGIARAIETASGPGDTAERGVVLGTPAYMAPEQVAGDSDIDPRVDIYQAGLVMHEMLTGALPYQADPVREPRPALGPGSPRRPQAPSNLMSLVTRCSAQLPADRPQSVDAVLSELGFIAPTEVLPTSPAGARADRAGRHVARYAAAAVVLVLGGAALTVLRAPSGSTLAEVQPNSSQGDSRGTLSLAARESYLRGMDVALLRSDSGRHQGVAHFGRAIALDSTYAAAYAGLSRMYVQLMNATPIGERDGWSNLAEAAALRAVTLDELAPEAHAALGWVRLITGGYAAAEAAFLRALELNPDVPRGHEGLARVYMMVGRPVDQFVQARLGLDVDPFSHSAIREWALAMAANGRCEDALDLLRPLKELSPPATVAGIIGGMCYATRAMWPEAIAEFRWSGSAGDDSAVSAPAFLGYTLARAGQEVEAAAILADLLAGRQESHGSFGIASVHAGMGHYDEAFAWLDRAIDEGSVTAYVMHPMFADLHRDPRFTLARARMGIEVR